MTSLRSLPAITVIVSGARGPSGTTDPVVDALGDAPDKAISQRAATIALNSKFDETLILTWAATLTDVNGGEPPAGRCFYLDGTVLKFKGS